MHTNGKKGTVLVAMSGGVDSSVAAALLLEQGYHVIGVTMKTYDFDEVGGNIDNESSCCGLGAVYDARLVAAKLGIPHYVTDFRDEFGNRVVDYFVEEYLRGRTPNPCVMCNRDIKWGELLKKAQALGADCIATGHYARVRYDGDKNRYVISRALFAQKDQSYALWALSQEALSKTLFPLGEMTKPDVRGIAQRLGLRTADKQESFEICFVADNDYTRFLKERVDRLGVEIQGGDIVWDGKIVGKHQGYPFYTIGQRKGIGAFGRKMYVTGVDAASNTLQIGEDGDLYNSRLVSRQVNWVSIAKAPEELRASVMVRYKDKPEPATIYSHEGTIRVVFDAPKRAITPGQSVVFYDGDDLLGGGIIDDLAE
ncbi:MAG: tRNA 2-thiouridine(34) synthase MnmA [Ignavibacteriales bacterium]|nr:tRNA 2-thiouridine(34) synthase MnmA [Ignavibacteriales bacterium]